MIFDYITEFAGYLNDRGYAVTQNKISRFLSLKNEETDFTREAEIIPLMKLFFRLFLPIYKRLQRILCKRKTTDSERTPRTDRIQ